MKQTAAEMRAEIAALRALLAVVHRAVTVSSAADGDDFSRELALTRERCTDVEIATSAASLATTAELTRTADQLASWTKAPIPYTVRGAEKPAAVPAVPEPVTTITETKITSNVTPHYACVCDGGWAVTWLPERVLNRDEAITAMTIAEIAAVYAIDPANPTGAMIAAESLASELGITVKIALAAAGPQPDDRAAWGL